MLTREWMGVLALGILWVNTLLVAGAALQRVGSLLALANRIGRAVRRGVAPEGLAMVTVEQVGRYGAGAKRNIVWHDRAYGSIVSGGVVDVGGGESIEVPAASNAMVWVDEATMRTAAALPNAAAFDEAYTSARKAKGFTRKVTASVRSGSEVFVGKLRDAERDTWIVAAMDPVAWCRKRAWTIAAVFVPGIVAIAAGITAVALIPPAFGTVSMIGAGLGVLYFLLVLPAGTAVRDWARAPHERIVRGSWTDPEGRPTPASADVSTARGAGKKAAAGAVMLAALALTENARADEPPKPYPASLRFHGSIGGALGSFLTTETRPTYYQAASLIHGQAGFQFSDLISTYGTATIGFGAGEEAALYTGLGWMVELTFEDRIFFGLGLEELLALSLDGNSGTNGITIGGGRVRLGGYPLTFGHRDTAHPRRRGLAVGAELGVHPFPDVVALSPALFVAYEVY